MLHWILQPLEKSKMMQLMQKKIGGGEREGFGLN